MLSMQIFWHDGLLNACFVYSEHHHFHSLLKMCFGASLAACIKHTEPIDCSLNCVAGAHAMALCSQICTCISISLPAFLFFLFATFSSYFDEKLVILHHIFITFCVHMQLLVLRFILVNCFMQGICRGGCSK